MIIIILMIKIIILSENDANVINFNKFRNLSFATLVKLAVNMAVNMGVIWASYWAQGRDVIDSQSGVAYPYYNY